jgi:hydrogenase maturation protein HypF
MPLSPGDATLGRTRGRRAETSTRSAARHERRTGVTPDLATCLACGAEIEDSGSRRHGYPFTTCASCGPRYSIIESVPYERAHTSMRVFDMCPECEREVRTRGDRREGSRTNACPSCGPRAWLADPAGDELASGSAALDEAARRLRSGEVVGVRGSGGVHLSVDATRDEAVLRLRRRTGREAKPLGVMVRDLDEARRLAHVSDEEARQLEAPTRPMLLLRRRQDTGLAPSLAPGLDTVGVLVADTPLRRLLVARVDRPLVLTSGRLNGEPLVAGVRESFERLGHAADAFLLHDRDIVARCDDSVARVVEGAPVLLRRARGWVPEAVPLPIATPAPLLALGARLETTFTLAAGGLAYPSPRLGDLEELGTLDHFRRTLEHFQRLYGVTPHVVAHDPDAGPLSLRLARGLQMRTMQAVQHDHAHVAAVAGEHGVLGPVVGVVYEGHGSEGEGARGARVLVADPTSFQRVGQLRCDPVGQDGALVDAAGAHPGRSSMDGLFGAAAAVLADLRVERYAGEASLVLEALAGERGAAPLPFPRSRRTDEPWSLDPGPLLEALARGRDRGEDVRRLAAAFHESVAEATADLVGAVCAERRIEIVALAGDMFHNARLLVSLARRLRSRGARVLRPRRLPLGDGAISYGQAVVGAARLARSEEA